MSIAEERIAAARARGAHRLSLRKLQLSELPDSLAQLGELRELDLGANRLTRLPRAVLALRGLEELDLSGNALTELPEGIAELGALRALHAGENPLQSLPAALAELAELRELDVHAAALRSLPDALWRLPALQVLNLSGNALAALPAAIAQLRSLRALELGGCGLHELPDSLGELAQLRVLGLSQCALREFPAALAELGELRALALERSALSELPESIARLTRLQRLWLRGNQLRALPAAIAELHELEELDLRENQLHEIPAVLGALARLARLELADNPLDAQGQLVAGLGSAALLSFLRGPRAERRSAELLLLGAPGAGKTSLARALRGRRSSRAPRAPGAELSRCALPLPAASEPARAAEHLWSAPLRALSRLAGRRPPHDRGELALRIWDGADPAVRDRLQPRGLAERALCIAVHDARSGALEALEAELDAIRQRAPQARALLATTRGTPGAPALAPADFAARVRELVLGESALDVELSSRRGALALRERIAAAFAELQRAPLPGSERYIRAERALLERARRDPFLSRAELGLLLQRADLPEPEHEAAAAVLHELGALLHFPEVERLADFVVLDLPWLAQALRCALESGPPVCERGVLRLGALRAIWDERYPDLFPQLYALLCHLDLCVPLAGSVDLALVPQRLPATRPPLPWTDVPGAAERRIEYTWSGSAPEPLMSRFIAKVHALVLEPGAALPASACWRDGVFLARGEGAEREQALCELERSERRIALRVRAAYPQHLLEQVDARLRAALSHYPGFAPQRSYGCVARRAQPCPATHSEERVLYHLQLGKPLLCETSRHGVDPFPLVCGLSSFANAGPLRSALAVELERRPEWVAGLGSDPAYALLRGEQLEGAVLELIRKREELPAALQQLLRQNRRELLALLDTREPRATPALFTVHPLARGRFDSVDWQSERYCLRLYCEAEDHVHPSSYSTELALERESWLRMQPALGIALRILSLSLAPALAAGALVQPAEFEERRAEVSFALELQRLLPASRSGADDALRALERVPAELGAGSARDRMSLDRQLAEFSAVLAQLDPEASRTQRWGDLQHCLLPDQSRRWLCPRHRPLQ